MIGQLPKSLIVDGNNYKIRTDFRVALLIFQAFNDTELSDNEKMQVMVECLYENIDDVNENNIEESMKQAVWFLDGGPTTTESSKKVTSNKKIIDWEQDEQMIFSAINKVAGYETRATEYLHWWTFLGFFNEIGEGLFTTVISIRNKKNKGKKLEKHEQEFYRENKSLIDLKQKYSVEEQEEIDFFNKLLNS